MIKVQQEGNVVFFETDDCIFLYDVSTGVLSQISEMQKSIIAQKANDISDEKIEDDLEQKYPRKDIHDILAQLKGLKDNKVLFNENELPVIRTADLPEEEWNAGNILENLVINISHECNMMCKYCFADHGHFQGNSQLMTKEIAEKSINYWFEHLDKTRKHVTVTFFGGEPLLNTEILTFGIEYIEKLISTTNVKVTYAITTNGTIMNEELIKFFLKYKIQPDISFDGTKYIQNKNRPLRSGKESYDIISGNLAKLKKYYKRMVAKVTLIHEDIPNLKESICSLWDMGFTDVFYICALTDHKELSIASEDINLLRDQLKELADITFQNIISGKSGRIINFIDIGHRLHNNVVKNECAFLNPFTIHITPEGKIYKCGKMVGMTEYCMGDIEDGVDWSKFDAKPKLSVLEDDKCNKCWARRICGGGCAYSNIIYNQDVNEKNPLLCMEKKIQVEMSLYLYIKLYQYDKELFKSVYEKPMGGSCIE